MCQVILSAKKQSGKGKPFMGRIYIYHEHSEALVLQNLLESHGIPVRIHSFENWGYDGLFRSEVGMGEILVPDTLEEKATQLIHTFKEETEKKRSRFTDTNDAGED